MKAIVYEKYGAPEVIEFSTVEKPTPKDHQVLIQVQAASVNAYDWHFLTADIFVLRFSAGLLKPKNKHLGADVAGRVEAMGKAVTQFQVGDEVFGMTHGSFAEYVCAAEKSIARKPRTASFAEASAIPMAGVTALQALRDVGQVQAGQKVLINGASGGVGTFAVQIAKLLGAHVTAVCSPRNVAQARSLGADAVIDYTQQDFTQSPERYDLILAVNGYHPLSAYKRALTPKGIYASAGGTPAQIFQALLLGKFYSESNGRQMKAVMTENQQSDLVFLAEQFDAGKLKSVIDKAFPLEQTADAMRYLGAGHAQGKVVIHVGAE
jgi:NADPH:quinone reductase-like Zn-dependent oxidoreductase